ncbi:RNA-directed DNA polymerase, eukaryota, reverse transcriptase zinc-binding domain protein [Tanacetum coccineum]
MSFVVSSQKSMDVHSGWQYRGPRMAQLVETKYGRVYFDPNKLLFGCGAPYLVTKLASIDAKVDQGCANEEDFINRLIPKDYNSSFIALIPKVSNAKFVNDFHHISLIGCQYKIIGKLLANRLGSVIRSCISSEQYAFIKGRNILDGPLILNEVMAWYRKRKKELMVFKVDFEKAFDSLRWDYLDMIMGKLGFGHKWCFWIFGCLHSARSSILVNGSPASEFDICRGLRQGDPLSPFLFILAMEGLHMLTHKAEAMGIFKGVPEAIVSNMAYSIGCEVAGFPMKYLGVPVGCNMAICFNWKVITQTFSSKLALWKARLLSVGGRLSLIKYVLGHLPTYYMSIYPMPSTIVKKLESMRNQFFLGGDIDERKMSWVRWNKCLASKDLGGLGIGRSSKAFMGLMEASMILLLVALATTLGEEDVWCGEQPLKTLFPRIYMLDTDRLCLVMNRIPFQDVSFILRRQPRGGGGIEMAQLSELHAKIEHTTLFDQGDSWIWMLDSSGFSVASVRYLVDYKTLDTAPNATRWIRHIPIKVNIFIWRLMLNKLPSRVNLDRRGIDVNSILCPICQMDIEMINHKFFSCDMTLDL